MARTLILPSMFDPKMDIGNSSGLDAEWAREENEVGGECDSHSPASSSRLRICHARRAHAITPHVTLRWRLSLPACPGSSVPDEEERLDTTDGVLGAERAGGDVFSSITMGSAPKDNKVSGSESWCATLAAGFDTRARGVFGRVESS
jgi:hypothetical protein